MNKNALIPRRKVLGLGVTLAGLCAGCAVLPDAGSAESAARSGAASASASTGAEEKAPRTELNNVHLRDNPELANDIEGQIRANADKLYASRRSSGRAAAADKAEEAAAPAEGTKEPVVKAPARSSESELDIMVED